MLMPFSQARHYLVVVCEPLHYFTQIPTVTVVGVVKIGGAF